MSKEIRGYFNQHHTPHMRKVCDLPKYGHDIQISFIH